MTPQEQKLVAELFDRLQSLENAPRDPDAVRLINDGLRRAPNAVYSLVQTVLLQDQALKNADGHIRELQGAAGAGPGGTSGTGRTSVPEVPRGGGGVSGTSGGVGGGVGGGASSRSGGGVGGTRGVWNTQPGSYAPAQPQGTPQAQGYEPPQQGGGGSFLGTAAATAAGVVGGALLMNSLRGMFGGHGGHSFGGGLGSGFPGGSGSGSGAPWGPDASGSGMARDAGLGDIGKSPSGGPPAEPSRFAGADKASESPEESGADTDDDFDDTDDTDVAGDFDGGDGGSDTA